ncbi:mannose/glucose-specific lectin-like [Carex rostrata]
MDPTCITRIVKIIIYRGDKINGLTVYFERNGITQCTSLWGKIEGKVDEINFKTNEYIKSVKGYLDDSDNMLSLILVTNFNVYGPYDKEGGRFFKHTSLHGQIISFFACVGINCVFRLGVYIKVFTTFMFVKTTLKLFFLIIICYLRKPLPISKSVPCGGSGGSPRDMDDVSAIYKIYGVTIRYDDTIHALSVRCRLNDSSFKQTLWGRETGKLTEINFHEDEYIKSVRGYVGYFGDIFTVRSLQLITNYKSYGPYGKEEGTPFELSAFDGRIIGFHGRSGEYLNAIGVYVEVRTSITSHKQL